MKIQVTQEDCDSLCFGDPKQCMLARALFRATGDCFSVGSVNAFSFRCMKTFDLPHAACLARYAYDARKKVEPFEFELEGYEL